MTSKEVVSLVAMATANFPSYQERDLKPTILLWRETLSDMPFDIAKAALIKVLSTANFWPTIAEIREAALFVTNQTAMSGQEAWELFEKADDKFGYYKVEEAMGSLPEPVRKTINAMGGFRSLSSSENVGVSRGQFMKIYEQLSSRDNEMGKLPQSLQEMIQSTTRGLPQISD